MKLILGDCLEKMKDIESGSVDMVLTDPPYGTTACKWDSIIPLNKYIITKKGKKDVVMYEDEWVINEARSTHKSIHQCEDEFKYISKFGMWDHLNRIIKPNGAIVMTASQPFTTILISSNIKPFKYCWVWHKRTSANVAAARFQPLKTHEDIVVFGGKYKPLMVKGKMRKKGGKVKGGIANGSLPPKYYMSDEYYPVSVLDIKTERGFHPTQKPIALMEYLIKTYTNENETVLDFTMGSGTTGVACKILNRDFIGIELDENYFNIAKERIENA